MAKIACFLLFYFLSFVNAQSDSLVVHINSGLIEGAYVHSEVINTSYYSFRGIPYAKPPVGKLRFLPPVEPEPWDHVLETKAHGSICVQIFGGSEDCLYLNVYTPNLPSNNGSTELLPVMVFIHGGAFLYGSSSNSEYGPDYLIDKNVVIVTLNYRVNIFGFLNAMEESAPGNVGLKDQLAALQWVQKNIDKFNGDPKQVTLFGQSAGACAVQYHMQAELSKGLFQRAIVQSGSSLDSWALEEEPLDLIHKLGNVLNIDSTNITEIINKMRSIPAEKLFEASESKKLVDNQNRTTRIRFVPSIEYDSPNAFVRESSYALTEGNKMNAVPFIMGHVSNEGLMFAGDSEEYESFLENPLLLVSGSLNIFNDTASRQLVLEDIKKQYFSNDSMPLLLLFANFQTDEMFVRGIRKSVELLRNDTTIYHYVFDYKTYDDGLPGVVHASELKYIFYIKNDPTITEEEISIREKLTTLWTNYAKTGNPTPIEDQLLDNLNWPAVSKPEEDLQYLYFGKKMEIRENPRQEYYYFWENIFRTYGRPPFFQY